MREELIERLRELEAKEGVCGQSDVRRLAFREAAALEAAREDVERYRWLADNAESLPYPDMWRDKEWLDAAIDQARGKEVV